MTAQVLVIGGSSFIGYHLYQHLLEGEYDVVTLDNFAMEKTGNLLPLLGKYVDQFKQIVGDICNLEDCKKTIERVGYVLHEAILDSVPRSIKDPITTSAVNIGAFLNMLVAARYAKVKCFVYATNSSTYGDRILFSVNNLKSKR